MLPACESGCGCFTPRAWFDAIDVIDHELRDAHCSGIVIAGWRSLARECQCDGNSRVTFVCEVALRGYDGGLLSALQLTSPPPSPSTSSSSPRTRRWHGVTCTPIVVPYVVEQLDLSDNGLTGTFPAVDTLCPFNSSNEGGFGGLFMVKTLDMSNNSIGGQLPSGLAAFWNLRVLNLGQNSLTGTIPEQLNNLTTPYPSLMEIDLNNNQLSGTIPGDLFGAEALPIFYPRDALKTLNLRFNKLTGALPDRVIRLTYMSGIGKGGALLLNGNQMSGGKAFNDTENDFISNIQYCDLTGQAFVGMSKATLTQCVR